MTSSFLEYVVGSFIGSVMALAILSAFIYHF